MKTLLLRLAAPQQSWGGPATQKWRPTEKVPTRTGVEGLLSACLGVPRGARDARLAALDMHVRVDRAGTVEEDFHTVTPPPADVALIRQQQFRLRTISGKGRADFAVPLANGFPWTMKGKVQTLTTHRLYLADAEFMLAVTGPADVIEELDAAVHDPVFTPFLGRQAYAPRFPFHLGTRDGEGLSVLGELPSTAPAGRSLPVYQLTGARPAQVQRIDPERTTTPLIDWKRP